MSGLSYFALFALIAMVIFYVVEDQSALALLGFSAASALAALSEFILGHWPFGIVALGFAGTALHRWYVRRHLDSHT
jgi:hypothetical protein